MQLAHFACSLEVAGARRIPVQVSRESRECPAMPKRFLTAEGCCVADGTPHPAISGRFRRRPRTAPANDARSSARRSAGMQNSTFSVSRATDGNVRPSPFPFTGTDGWRATSRDPQPLALKCRLMTGRRFGHESLGAMLSVTMRGGATHREPSVVCVRGARS